MPSLSLAPRPLRCLIATLPCLFAGLEARAATLHPDIAVSYLDAVRRGDARLEPEPHALSTPGAVLERIAPADYADSFAAPAGADRPGPRALSEAFAADPRAFQHDPVPLSALTTVLGQFWISHMIARSPTLAGPEHGLAFPLAEGDPIARIGTDGAPVLIMQRAAAVGGSGPDDVREQTSDVTPAFDGSTTYGSTPERLEMLRARDGTGRLLVGPDDGLPVLDGLPVSGDVRALENPVLTAVHTLFHREHNRLADAVAASCAASGTACSDDEIFRMAANLNIAQQQKIFYDDVLPTLLGTGDLASLLPDPGVLDRPPAILNEATTAALRFGHSQVTDTIRLVDADGARRDVALADCFFSLTCLDGVPLGDVLLGAIEQPAEAVDLRVADGLRQFLLASPVEAARTDLLAVNIARGRDHGLADFVTICTALGFAACDVPDHVREVYGDATVDAIVGFLGEDRSAGGYLGPVTSAAAALQFALIRRDDPNFYDSEGMFDAATLDWIEGRSLSDIIADNSWLPRAMLPHDIFRAGRIGPIARHGDIAPIPLPAGFPLALAAFGLLALAGRRRR